MSNDQRSQFHCFDVCIHGTMNTIREKSCDCTNKLNNAKTIIVWELLKIKGLLKIGLLQCLQ